MTEALQKLEEALLRCNKCGLCLAGCPIYKVTGIEWTAARGRLAVLRSALENELKLDELTEPIFNCLTCNGCVDHCPPGVMTDEVIMKARAELMKQRGQPWVQKFVFHDLLPHPSRLSKSAQLLGWVQAAGLPTVARGLGITRLMGKVGRAERLLPRIPPKQKVDGTSKKLENPKYRVAYFVGCAAANFTPQVAEAAIRVLNKHNAEVAIPDFICCGMPAMGYGDAESMLSMVKKNLDLAKSLKDVDAIITTCATCGSMLKKYASLLAAPPACPPLLLSSGRRELWQASLLKDDAQYAEAAKTFSAKVKDISEFLVGIGLVTEMKDIKAKVTYHDPCHLGRFQKVSDPPRQILKSIPGVQYVEMTESNLCCGAAGSYSLSHYDLSMKVLARKMGNLARTDADLIVTCCPGCSMQLAHGVKTHHLKTKATELVELLDRAYHPEAK
jgi:glycolate oxidase iron-sulfur subunit